MVSEVVNTGTVYGTEGYRGVERRDTAFGSQDSHLPQWQITEI